MPQKLQREKVQRPPQHQNKQPGLEYKMKPRPEFDDATNQGAGKLSGKVALITGGDSGIGRAVAVAFAKEGADVVIVYLNEHRDAKETKSLVEDYGRTCLLIAGDIGDEAFCRRAISKTLRKLKRLDILVNNAAIHYPQKSIEKITSKQLERTFRTNIFSFFYMTKAALKHFKSGATVINTASVTAYRGSAHLVDYAATKGAIVSFTRSLAQQVVEKGIRVNGVAPGPIEPEEVAPCYVFLASDESSYITGQVLHPNGGEIVNG
jgi:NAD(P)-dependent dehydrogenase (short-subunit alcohol dehydrogenase family)